MITIRQFTTDDLLAIQTQNLLSLPENYTMKYYYFHILTGPELSWVAVNDENQIVGYVLGKPDDDDKTRGAITSVAVCREYRRLGIAQRLMRQVEKQMIQVYGMTRCRLSVRETNYAARHLYADVLGFKMVDVDVKYYGDGENGINMEQDLVELRKELCISPAKNEEKEDTKPVEKKDNTPVEKKDNTPAEKKDNTPAEKTEEVKSTSTSTSTSASKPKPKPKPKSKKNKHSKKSHK